jgi:hypothetical protein
VEDVDPFLCTHVIYAFAKVQGNTVQPFEWNDMPDWGKSISFHSFTNIQTNLYRGRRCRDYIDAQWYILYYYYGKKKARECTSGHAHIILPVT